MWVELRPCGCDEEVLLRSSGDEAEVNERTKDERRQEAECRAKRKREEGSSGGQVGARQGESERQFHHLVRP